MENKNLTILYHDDYFVAVDKPVGIPVHKNEFMAKDTDYLTKLAGQTINQSVYNVHRLDAKTSGVVVLALSSAMANKISVLFEKRQVEKKYMAIIRGNPGNEGVFDDPVSIRKKGKKVKATTNFKTKKNIVTDISYKNFDNTEISLVELMPETGRWHQLRQHMAMHRFDIIGDVQHGDWTLNKIIAQKYDTNRLFLHAKSIAFKHPATDEDVIIESNLPNEFSELLRLLS